MLGKTHRTDSGFVNWRGMVMPAALGQWCRFCFRVPAISAFATFGEILEERIVVNAECQRCWQTALSQDLAKTTQKEHLERMLLSGKK